MKNLHLQLVELLPYQGQQLLLLLGLAASLLQFFAYACLIHHELISFLERLDSAKSSARNLNHGAIDYGAIEAVLGHGFIDVVASQRSADSPYVGTFPTRLIDDKDHGPDRRIDFIFVSRNLQESVLSAGILRDATTEVLSDHIPVVAVIDMVLE